MFFDWVTWSIWLLGLIIFIIWIFVPIKEYRQLMNVKRDKENSQKEQVE